MSLSKKGKFAGIKLYWYKFFFFWQFKDFINATCNFSAEIVERGIRNHPELGIGAQAETEGGARSVGNPPALAMSGLTQALNLKAAIEYQEKNSIL